MVKGPILTPKKKPRARHVVHDKAGLRLLRKLGHSNISPANFFSWYFSTSDIQVSTQRGQLFNQNWSTVEEILDVIMLRAEQGSCDEQAWILKKAVLIGQAELAPVTPHLKSTSEITPQDLTLEAIEAAGRDTIKRCPFLSGLVSQLLHVQDHLWKPLKALDLPNVGDTSVDLAGDGMAGNSDEEELVENEMDERTWGEI